MARPKIKDAQEVARWIEEGKSYQEMADIYAERGIQVTPAAFASLRYRMGLPRKKGRHLDLVPWEIKPEHRWETPVMYLRAEGRRRKGGSVPAERLKAAMGFIKFLDQEGLVVHYDPDTKKGFWLIPREDYDEDYIRHPDDLPQDEPKDELAEWRP